MRVKRTSLFWPSLLVALLVVAALTFAASGKLRRANRTDSNARLQPAGPSQAHAKRGAYVRPGLLSSKLVWHLKAMGDRLEKPGRERLNLTGTLTRANDWQTNAIVAVSEFPDRLRLTMQKGAEIRVITFDGHRAEAAMPSVDTAEQDLIETLVYGTAEHFFDTQMQGMAMRFLGSRFRLDDGSSADYSGPYYDVYKVADRVNTSADQGERIKLYYFNSETLLLERVTYEINRHGSTVKVEERLGDWTKEAGQQVARRIERFENGESVFVLTVRTAHLSARADDGVFAN